MKTIIIPQNNIIFENGPQINPSLEQETMNSLSLSLSLSLVRLNEQKKKKKMKREDLGFWIRTFVKTSPKHPL